MVCLRGLTSRVRRPFWAALSLCLCAGLLLPVTALHAQEAPPAPLRGEPVVLANEAPVAAESLPVELPDGAPLDIPLAPLPTDASVGEETGGADTGEVGASGGPGQGLTFFLPLAAFTEANPAAPPSSLPRLINGAFDDVGGWVQMQNGVATTLVVTNGHAALGGLGISTPPNVIWLGGVRAAHTHSVSQTVRLPADYSTQLLFDYIMQSAETVCGKDSAGLYVNGVLHAPTFRLCRETGNVLNTWRETAVNLSAFRGQEVSIEFRLVGDGEPNSNLWLDNFDLCGVHRALPAAQRCPAAGWQEVSTGSAGGRGVSNSNGRSFRPALAVAPSGRAYLAWADGSSGNNEIYVRRWNGMAWEEATPGSARGGGISNTRGESLDPAIAIAPNGTVYVAWQEFVQIAGARGAFEVYVRRLSGGLWQEVGAGSASGRGASGNSGNSFGVALALGPGALGAASTPYIAWADDQGVLGGNLEIYARRFDGVGWVELGPGGATGGGVSRTEGDSRDPSLAVAPNGSLYLAWSDDSSGNDEIYVRRFTGSSWVDVGVDSAAKGGVSNSRDASQGPSLAVGPDGAPYVAWFDRSAGDTEIYVRRFVGGLWQEMGANSATGGGISNNAGSSLDPALAVALSGRVTVAWQDRSGSNADIYALQWTGTAWQRMGAGSLFPTGISNTGTFSSEPAVAITQDGIPYVAWNEAVLDGQIYVRRFVP